MDNKNQIHCSVKGLKREQEGKLKLINYASQIVGTVWNRKPCWLPWKLGKNEADEIIALRSTYSNKIPFKLVSKNKENAISNCSKRVTKNYSSVPKPN